MTSLRNFRIGARLAAAFAFLLISLCLVAGFGAMQTAKVNDNVVDIGTNWLQAVKLLGDMRGVASDMRRASLSHVLAADPDAKKKLLGSHDTFAAAMPAVMAGYEKTVRTPEEKALYDAVKSAWASFLEACLLYTSPSPRDS